MKAGKNNMKNDYLLYTPIKNNRDWNLVKLEWFNSLFFIKSFLQSFNWDYLSNLHKKSVNINMGKMHVCSCCLANIS